MYINAKFVPHVLAFRLVTATEIVAIVTELSNSCIYLLWLLSCLCLKRLWGIFYVL
jgi:hypothetical protein